MAITEGKAYKYTGDYKIANKNLGTGTAVTINGYEPINDLEGYLILSPAHVHSSVDNVDTEFNYYSFKINGKTKYFMVTSREAMTGGRCRVNLYQDVLKTWWDEIKDWECIVSTSVDSRAYTKDAPGSFPCYQYHKISQNAIGSPDLSYRRADGKSYYVLVTVGKGWAQTEDDSAVEWQKKTNEYHEQFFTGETPDYN